MKTTSPTYCCRPAILSLKPKIKGATNKKWAQGPLFECGIGPLENGFAT
jgi:hypothetical protein